MYSSKLNYLVQTEPELLEAAKAAGITKDEAIFFIDLYFQTIAEIVDDDRMPKFSIPFIGVFHPTMGMIRRALMMSYTLFKEGKVARIVHEFKILKFWPIRNRIIKEESECVHYWWARVPKDWVKQAYPEKYAEIDDFINNGGKEEFDKARGMKDKKYKTPTCEI